MLTGQHPAQHMTRARAGSSTRPSCRAAHIELADWCVVAGVFDNWPKEEILVEMMTAGEVVAANEAGVFLFEVMKAAGVRQEVRDRTEDRADRTL